MNLYPKTDEQRDQWVEDYRYLGYDVSVKDGVVIVHELPQKKEPKDAKNRPGNRRKGTGSGGSSKG